MYKYEYIYMNMYLHVNEYVDKHERYMEIQKYENMEQENMKTCKHENMCANINMSMKHEHLVKAVTFLAGPVAKNIRTPGQLMLVRLLVNVAKPCIVQRRLVYGERWIGGFVIQYYVGSGDHILSTESTLNCLRVCTVECVIIRF
jgi:hypothetical protein